MYYCLQLTLKHNKLKWIDENLCNIMSVIFQKRGTLM